MWPLHEFLRLREFFVLVNRLKRPSFLWKIFDSEVKSVQIQKEIISVHFKSKNQTSFLIFYSGLLIQSLKSGSSWGSHPSQTVLLSYVRWRLPSRDTLTPPVPARGLAFCYFWLLLSSDHFRVRESWMRLSSGGNNNRTIFFLNFLRKTKRITHYFLKCFIKTGN